MAGDFRGIEYTWRVQSRQHAPVACPILKGDVFHQSRASLSSSKIPRFFREARRNWARQLTRQLPTAETAGYRLIALIVPAQTSADFSFSSVQVSKDVEVDTTETPDQAFRPV